MSPTLMQPQNRIRMSLDEDYYGMRDRTAHGVRVHLDHCLDYLRQSIQCSADMTPVIMYFQPWINMTLVSQAGRFSLCR
ncbi:hypothetical protein A1O7_06647 [Cladophialophora yegresii CBS 114405]|uniref:Uncharacterized protein n=1 Tax=Cladophialophora yegresii CBS 114405 TaxID=1182544 RepID=W9W2I5_9EURO|nr:uncharacterized protein A1O7_06647 [Cladophialophora yegresii CBS 114405]EXJ59215.1 hypothetical protein A1O7_06647 [Cladophialophora yegresii CBS 114405]